MFGKFDLMIVLDVPERDINVSNFMTNHQIFVESFNFKPTNVNLVVMLEEKSVYKSIRFIFWGSCPYHISSQYI